VAACTQRNPLVELEVDVVVGGDISVDPPPGTGALLTAFSLDPAAGTWAPTSALLRLRLAKGRPPAAFTGQRGVLRARIGHAWLRQRALTFRSGVAVIRHDSALWLKQRHGSALLGADCDTMRGIRIRAARTGHL
jgi:hypothetical protein